MKAQGYGVRAIARELSAILQRCRGSCGAMLPPAAASPSTGRRWRSGRLRPRPAPKLAKLVTNPRLQEYVQNRLSGQLQGLDGAVATGPSTTWKGLNKPHRADRRWATAWSPEQISARLVVDFPDDEDMRISHEAIYQALYIQGRGALKRELVACLRTGRALRKPRERARNRPQGHVSADVVLSERPGEVEDRAVPGHWEGDLIIGLNRSAIGTVVERSSRYTLLVHLPRLEGYGTIAPVKNGPALGGYGAIAMKDALTTTMTTMPAEPLRSLTCVDDHVIPQGLRSSNSPGLARRVDVYRVVVVALVGDAPGSFAGSVAGSVHEDLVAGVDQPVEQGLGDDGVGEQRIPVDRVPVARSGSATGRLRSVISS